MSKASGRLTLKAQLIQAHIKLQLATPGEGDSRTATLARHGGYEVRLIEPSDTSEASALLFWIELFDHGSRRSIDSGCRYVIEDAVVAAEHLILQAKELGDGSDRA